MSAFLKSWTFEYHSNDEELWGRTEGFAGYSPGTAPNKKLLKP